MADVDPVIGIDLGTTYSCVAVRQNGQTKVIISDDGSYTIPSYVAFTKHECLVGDTAKSQQEINSQNTVFDIKRIIGRMFTDPIVQGLLNEYPFKIISKADKAAIEVEFFGKTESFFPEEISAMILKKLKKRAESHLGCVVKRAVITVPVQFNNAQREATKVAAKIAGMDVLTLINEPTAAAIAYGIDGNVTDYIDVVVFDLGGGTFDVSVLSLGDNVLEVAACKGNSHLGGEDFVKKLVDHCLIDIKKSIQNVDNLKADKESMQRLRSACEIAKTSLSERQEYKIVLPCLFEGKRFEKSITRPKFNALNKDFFKEAIDTVESVLVEAKKDIKQIHEVILVGGSTRIPFIREKLKSMFNIDRLNESVSADQAVALGAATQGAKLTAQEGDPLKLWVFNDVTAHTLSTESRGICYMMIPRNKLVPTSYTRQAATTRKNQTRAKVTVYEGDNIMAAENRFLGIFRLENLTQAEAGETKIDIKFTVTSDGILEAKATDVQTGNSASHNLTVAIAGSLTEEKIEEMKKRLDGFSRAEEKIEEGLKIKCILETTCNSLIDAATESHDREKVEKECADIMEWLDEEKETIPDPAEFYKRFNSLKTFLPEDEEFTLEIKKFKPDYTMDKTSNEAPAATQNPDTLPETNVASAVTKDLDTLPETNVASAVTKDLDTLPETNVAPAVTPNLYTLPKTNVVPVTQDLDTVLNEITSTKLVTLSSTLIEKRVSQLCSMKGYDWICRKCKAENFPTLESCYSCHKSKD